MIDPIGPRPPGTLWEIYGSGEGPVKNDAVGLQKRAEAAREQAVSYYYVTTLQSLKAAAESNTDVSSENTIAINDINDGRKTIYQYVTTWFWGLLGYKTEESSEPLIKDSVSHADAISPLSQSPKLQQPEPMSKERLSQYITILNKELFIRLKDTEQFEKELHNSKNIDKVILVHILQKSLDQRKLKEGTSLQEYEEILKLQKINGDLSRKYYQILEEINIAARRKDIVHWVNFGTSIGIAGMVVGAFVTGGMNLAYGIVFSALNVLKGGFGIAEGIMKYDVDLRKGEITMVEHYTRKNNSDIHDKVETSETLNTQISDGIKALLQHMNTYHHHVRQMNRS